MKSQVSESELSDESYSLEDIVDVSLKYPNCKFSSEEITAKQIKDLESNKNFEIKLIEAHESSVNSISVIPGSSSIAHVSNDFLLNGDIGEIIELDEFNSDEIHISSANPLNTKPYPCDLCTASFSQLCNMKAHRRVHTGERPYECARCKASFKQFSNLKTHLKLHSGEKPFGCKFCNARFRQQSNLERHELIHTGVRPYKCNYCGSSFVQSVHLRNHSRIHTNERPYTCETCNASFNQLSNLRTHEKKHTGEKPFACEACDASFTQKSNLKSHCFKIHGAKSVGKNTTHFLDVKTKRKKASNDLFYICKICDCTFSTYTDYITHMNIHCDEIGYVCATCDETFSNEDTLALHLQETHSESNPFVCPDCSARFRQKASFLQHVTKIHKGQLENFSPFVSKLVKSNNRGELENFSPYITKLVKSNNINILNTTAIKSEPGVRTINTVHNINNDTKLITISDNSTNLLSNLASNDLFYVCKICDCPFSTYTDYTIHMQVHSDEIGYVCAPCDKTFSNEDTLTLHLQETHSESKPFFCPDCSASFRQKIGLLHHVMKKHKGQVEKFSPYIPKLVKSNNIDILNTNVIKSEPGVRTINTVFNINNDTKLINISDDSTKLSSSEYSSDSTVAEYTIEENFFEHKIDNATPEKRIKQKPTVENQAYFENAAGPNHQYAIKVKSKNSSSIEYLEDKVVIKTRPKYSD